MLRSGFSQKQCLEIYQDLVYSRGASSTASLADPQEDEDDDTDERRQQRRSVADHLDMIDGEYEDQQRSACECI